METSYVAKVYADSLRDNFEMPVLPGKEAVFTQLKSDFDAEVLKERPHLATLLRIEAALVEVIPADQLKARLWTTEDRFRRVVPLATRTRYESSVPPRGDKSWEDESFVRQQTRVLLDVIHANYLINIGRERSIKRLKLIILLALAAVLLVDLLVNLLTPAADFVRVQAFSWIVIAGVFGSGLSIVNRLQSAVSRDAMDDDGIFELTGLRMGWMSILTSLFMGGVFALVLYAIAMAGLLEVAHPEVQTNAAAAQQQVTTNSETSGNGDASSANPQTCSANTRNCFEAPAKLGNAIGLATGTDFFKMLILAFLAGFAERLVPDILGRLSKQHQGK